jgi:hypothetical protein
MTTPPTSTNPTPPDPGQVAFEAFFAAQKAIFLPSRPWDYVSPPTQAAWALAARAAVRADPRVKALREAAEQARFYFAARNLGEKADRVDALLRDALSAMEDL